VSTVRAATAVHAAVAAVDPVRVADEVLGEIESVPLYWSLGPGVVQRQVRALVDAAVCLVLAGYVDAPGSSESLADAARDLAVCGAPDHDIAEAFVLAATAARRAVAACAPPSRRADVLEYDRLLVPHIVRLSRELIAAAGEAGLADQEREARQRLQRRLRDPATAQDLPFALVLPAATAWVHALRARALREAGILAAGRGTGIVGLFAPHQSVAPGDALVVRGEAHADDGALDELLAVADIAAATGSRGVVAARCLVAERLLVSSPAVSDAAEALVLAPLRQRDRSAGLIAALAALFDAELDYARAAAAIGVHPNTLRYRIRIISAVTGLSPGRSRDLPILAVAACLSRRS